MFKDKVKLAKYINDILPCLHGEEDIYFINSWEELKEFIGNTRSYKKNIKEYNERFTINIHTKDTIKDMVKKYVFF